MECVSVSSKNDLLNMKWCQAVPTLTKIDVSQWSIYRVSHHNVVRIRTDPITAVSLKRSLKTLTPHCFLKFILCSRNKSKHTGAPHMAADVFVFGVRFLEAA